LETYNGIFDQIEKFVFVMTMAGNVYFGCNYCKKESNIKMIKCKKL